MNDLPQDAHPAKNPPGLSGWRLVKFILWFPFGLFYGMIVLGFLATAMAVLWPYAAIRLAVAERRFRAAMKSKGRFIILEDLRPRLIAGEGTLIEDMGQKGPYRLWWTQDDLSTLGSPASTRADFIAIYAGKGHPFNSRCLDEYLDEDTGKALLTSIPARYSSSGKLARMFPRVKTAKVFRPFVAPRKERAEGP